MNWVQENQYVDGYSGKDQPSFPERSMCFSQFTFLFGFKFFSYMYDFFFLSQIS